VKAGKETSSIPNIDSMTTRLVEFSKNSSITLTTLQKKIEDCWNENGKKNCIFY